MTGPRDNLAGLVVPMDPVTGRPVTPMQEARIQNMVRAVEPLFEAMHQAEGSIMPGDHQEHQWQSRRMAIAATHIETALLFANRAVMEVS